MRPNVIEYSKEIITLKTELRDKLVIAAHHYQHQNIVEIADLVGDSFMLSEECSKIDKKIILFCGVKFMADATQILAREDQIVLLPDPNAGCPLADMIDGSTTISVLDKINSIISSEITPVFYVNSNSDVKSICGERNGSTCTSSSALLILKHYLDKNKPVFFAPDFNLGINTADKLGITDSEIVKVDKNLNLEAGKDPLKAKLFIWDGNCRVHKKFKIESIEKLKNEHANIKIIVHPECDRQIVKSADLSGSTQFIYDQIKNSPENSVWGVGTEYNFVSRLQSVFSNKIIIPITESTCYNMARITEEKVLNSLRSIMEFDGDLSTLKHPVLTAPDHIVKAKKALETMIHLVRGNR